MTLRPLRQLARKCAPSWIRDIVNPPYASLSYSQEGEDRVLARLIGDSLSSGFYVDVGAHHPMLFSNTYAFYKKGWRGINIDAQPGAMVLFNKIRPRDLNLELAISNEKQTLTYYQFNEPAFNGFSADHASRWDGVAHYKLVGTIQIETVPLAEVLAKYLPPGQVIDFLSVDVEGLDEKVLRSNDWDKYKPNFVLVEEELKGLPDVPYSHIVLFLQSCGYELIAKTMNTLIFKLAA